MNVQAAVSRTNLRRLVGRELAVLVDSAGRGRTQWDAPEVDGIVKLSGGPAQPGRLTRALVTGSSTHDLRARVMGRACP
jgi:tRNA A37 methylthiotransferase MiaB